MSYRTTTEVMYASPQHGHLQSSHQQLYNAGNTIRIQPDLLPPHSKPQDLSPNQRTAFAGAVPCAPLLLSKTGVLHNQSQARVLAISKEAVHFPAFLSSKPLLTVTRCNTGIPVGTIRFHNLTTSDIQLNINGRETVLISSRLRKHWAFEPTSLSPSDSKKTFGTWFWKRDKVLGHSVILVDSRKAKRNTCIARIAKNTLIFEKPGLSNETLNEIIMTAVALAENARRRSKNADIIDLGFAIGDLAGGNSGGHSGVSHSSHGSSSGGGSSGGGDGGGGCSSGDGGGGGGGGGGDGGGGGGC